MDTIRLQDAGRIPADVVCDWLVGEPLIITL